MSNIRSWVWVLLTLVAGGHAAAEARETADLILVNGHVLAMDDSRTTLDNGVIVIQGSAIAAVGGRELLEQYRSDTVIDAGGDIVMPGMINLHNHLSMVAFRGLGETNFKDRLFRVMFPLEKALLSRELIRVAARQAAIESALSGVTTVTDMYYHEDEVARSVAEVGIRGVLGETVIGLHCEPERIAQGLASWFDRPSSRKPAHIDLALEVLEEPYESRLPNSLLTTKKLGPDGSFDIAAGLITGEALMGIFIAIPIVMAGRADVLALGAGMQFGGWLGLAMLAGWLYFFFGLFVSHGPVA